MTCIKTGQYEENVWCDCDYTTEYQDIDMKSDLHTAIEECMQLLLPVSISVYCFHVLHNTCIRKMYLLMPKSRIFSLRMSDGYHEHHLAEIKWCESTAITPRPPYSESKCVHSAVNVLLVKIKNNYLAVEVRTFCDMFIKHSYGIEDENGIYCAALLSIRGTVCMCFCCVAFLAGTAAPQNKPELRWLSRLPSCPQDPSPSSKAAQDKKTLLLCVSRKQKCDLQTKNHSQQPNAQKSSSILSGATDRCENRYWHMSQRRQQEALKPLYFNPAAVQYNVENRPSQMMPLIQAGSQQSGHSEIK